MAARPLTRADCAQALSGHRPASVVETLHALAAHPAAQAPADLYGSGGAVALLESRVAELLGKPAAMFFAKGMVAQMSALRVHADATRAEAVAVHARSHMALDEGDAVDRIGGLRMLRIGDHAPFDAAAVAAIAEPLAAVVVELPLRRAGYLLPEFAELRAIAAHCRARGVPLHLDGARLWETAGAWNVAPAEIAALADTVYVSFYKGLGGLGGAILAGPEAGVAALASWRGRHGHNLWTAWPMAVSALAGLDTQLSRHGVYRERALALAARLTGQVRLNPPVPHVNAFQIWFEGSPEALAARNRAFAEARGVWLFNHFQPAPLLGWSIAEVVIGDASDGWDAETAANWIADFARGEGA